MPLNVQCLPPGKHNMDHTFCESLKTIELPTNLYSYSAMYS